MLKLIRYLLVGIVVIFLTFLGLFVCMFRPKSVKNSDFFANRIGRIALFILGIKFKVINEENFYNNRPCIFISNHQSNIDAWTLASVLPNGAITMGKKTIIYIPIFGLFYYLCGHFLIDRKDKAGSKATINNLVTYLKEKSLSLWIMPEGTRNKGRGILPFKKGPFHLAVNSDLPIVTVCISTYKKSFDVNKWHSGTILIEPLKAISTKGKTVEALTVNSREMLMKGVEKLDLMRENG